MRYTSRSAQVTYQRCPRRWYLEYAYDGIGLRPSRTSFEIVSGVFVHHGLELLLKGMDIEDVIKALMTRYTLEISEENLVTYGCDFEQVSREQRCLIEGLVRAWFLVRYPVLIDEYDVIEVEKDRSFVLVDGVEEEFKIDALLRHKVTGLYSILSNKTVGSYDSRKVNDARNDVQGLSEMYGIETCLGIQVHSVIMENIITGKKDIETVNDIKQMVIWNPVVRGWYSPVKNEYAYKYQWEDWTGKHRLTKDFKRFASWEVSGGVKAWIDALRNGEFEPKMSGVNPLEELFSSVEYYRNGQDMEDWLEQTQEQELDVSKGLFALKANEDAPKRDKRFLLNKHFPQYRHSCNYPSRCGMYSICWEQGLIDPYSYGFVRRMPHHEKELGQCQS